ncbi:hypothetical protein [Sphingobium nicotianae]|uniref:Uncharacterized protein n=1 Tax=Sphingobium nicotianae TaxID=2782607 RepID=A0A9X1DEB7_9SPHN|nr:hypothetical protein [Sphingobium nicotianae]MBT2188378.1 hypothetical protein [Sphingobium nicotianae]
MSVETTISATGRVIQSIGALIALMPALALLLGLVQIPPSLADLIKVLSFFMTVGVILAVILLRSNIRKMSSSWAALLVIGTILAGSAAATAYLIVAERHLIAVKHGETVDFFVVPIHPSARIRAAIAPFQDDYIQALYVSVQREQLRRWMRDESVGASIVMMTLLMVANILLVAGLVTGAWKVAGAIRKPAQSAGADGMNRPVRPR